MNILHFNFTEVVSNYCVNFPLDLTPILAQTIENVDVLGDMESAWQNFVESGQVWALIIGLFLGYVFKGFTSY